MALSKYTAFLLDTNSFFSQDIILKKVGISETNKTRYKHGEFHIMYENIRKSKKEFFEYTGMSMDAFDYILENVRDELTSTETNYRIKNFIKAEEKLILTLRYMTTGKSYSALSNDFCMGRSTAAQLVHQTCKVLWASLSPQHMPKTNRNYIQSVIDQYWIKWQFPNCAGAIGERTVQGMRRRNKRAEFHNFPYYALQAIVDANYKFIAIEVNGKDKKCEDTFNTSKLNRRLQSNCFGVPPPQKLPDSDIILPNVLLGDEGYPLTRYLMRPFHIRNLTPDKRQYNERLSHARKPVKCAYEMLFTKWKFLSKTMTSTSLKNKIVIIQAACLLHNIIRDIDGSSDVHFQRGIETFSETTCPPNKMNNRPNSEALLIRDVFKDYLENAPQQTEK